MSNNNSFQRFHDEQSLDVHPDQKIRKNSTQKAHPQHHVHQPQTGHYNPLAMPPDWEFAQKHAMARRTAKEKDTEDGKVQDVCPCCGYELDRDDIGLCEAAFKLSFLGSGYPLFYNYIKYSILLLLTLACFESLPNLYIYGQGQFCDKTDLEAAQMIKKNNENPDPNFQQPCGNSSLLTMSMANIINSPFPDWQIYLQIAVQVLVMVELMVFRYHQRKIDIDVDDMFQTPADYSIIVKNIPQGYNGETIIKELGDKISNHAIFGKKIEVKKIVPVYKIDEFEHQEHKIKQAVAKKQELLSKNGVNYQDKEVIEADEKIEELEHELEKINKKIYQDPSQFAGIAFVSFNSEQEKTEVIEANEISQFQRFKLFFSKGASKKYLKNSKGKDVLYWKDRHVYIEQAPEPKDVDWEFIHETTNNRLLARVKSNMHQILLQIICFGGIYAISYFQSLQIDKAMEAVVDQEEGADFKYMMVRSISVLISAIIVLINKFWLGTQVHHIVDHEKWSTKTKLNISFAQKLTLALFSNTALITLAVEIVTFGNYYGVGGMISTESMVFVFNAIVPPLAWLVDPWDISKRSKRAKEIAKGDKSLLTQEEANLLCEHTEYINGKRYADMMKTMWFTFFYCPIVPFGTICSIFGLFIYYWIDKYNVIKRRTIKETISKDLTFQMIELLEFIVIFHAFGDFMFKRALFGFFEKKDFFILIAAMIYNLSPLQEINEFLFHIENEGETELYDDVVHDFDNDYDRENPIHKEEALKKWIEGRNKKAASTSKVWINVQ